VKAAFRAEAIGLGPAPRAAVLSGALADRRQPWVAEITGLDERSGLARTFLPRRLDYREANRSGDRGVSAWWTLESGRLYQARRRVTRTRWETLFLAVTGAGEIRDVGEEEALAWASAISAPTS
jgi:hypothetical protein